MRLRSLQKDTIVSLNQKPQSGYFCFLVLYLTTFLYWGIHCFWNVLFCLVAIFNFFRCTATQQYTVTSTGNPKIMSMPPGSTCCQDAPGRSALGLLSHSQALGRHLTISCWIRAAEFLSCSEEQSLPIAHKKKLLFFVWNSRQKTFPSISLRRAWYRKGMF